MPDRSEGSRGGARPRRWRYDPYEDYYDWRTRQDESYAGMYAGRSLRPNPNWPEPNPAFWSERNRRWDYGPNWEDWTAPGPYTGVGPRDYQRPPEMIREDVCERLTRHGWLDARNIQVEVDGTEVTLKGSVDSRKSKRLAEGIAEGVMGVTDVHNRLTIH